MGKDRPAFDASSEDRRRAFKFFIANFRDYCIMEDYINPAKDVDSDDYWIQTKRPKVMAALRRAFPQAEWDVLTTTIDSQIADEDKQHPAKWLAKLSNHYLGEEPIIQCTHNFLRILKQDPGMSIQQWHTAVRLEYHKCNFPSAVDDRLQRDIFVIGLNDTFKHFRSDLISRENLASLTFEQVINKARDFEAGLKTESAITKQQLEESVHQLTPSVLNKDTTDAAHKVTPNAIKSRTPRRPFKQHGLPASQSPTSSTCLWCGRTPHAARRDCPAANDTCHRCGKRGHWQQVCRASAANTVYQADTGFQSSTAYVITHDIAQVQSAPKGIFVDLDFSTTPSPATTRRIRFQVDSGCSCNTIHVTDLQKMSPVKVEPSSVRLLDYSKSIIPTGGQTTLHCTRQGKIYDVLVQVITAQSYYAPLLGLADSTRMGILNYNVDTVNQLHVASTPSLPPLGELTFDSIKANYPHLFEGLGELGEPYSLTLDPTIKPIQAAPHRYAAPKLPIIKEALDKLIDTGQLVRVNEPTPWISNMVVRERPPSATKPAKVRICLDPSQTINKAILRPVYPIPTLEENFHRFHQAKIFSTFDIKDAFQTIKLTEESSKLTTMHTPWGRYRWTRLPFGISSAPEEFQRRIQDVLCGLEGVVNIADDIIVIGRGTSLKEATHDHDRTVIELLDRLSRHHLKLNPDKVKLKTCSAPFMGHTLTPEGLKPSNEIANAVLNMPQPQDKAATRRFLGTITYLSKFCPRLNEVVRPLRDLTHIDQKFLWADQHTEALRQAKELVSQAPCLRYFDVKAPVVLQVDASEYGLGAALLQPATCSLNSSDTLWQPVAYSSSSLSQTEQRYAQIEKETLAIVHAFHKFDKLLFGKSDVVVHSDHKPLETIFKRPLASAPRRLQSMMLTLQRYTFCVEYHKGSTLHIADTLSRAPLPTTTHKQVHDEVVYRVEFETDTPQLSAFQDATLQELRTVAMTDPEQIALQSLIKAGWPNDKAAVPELARPYWAIRHELTAHDGLLFKQDRVIVPSSARPTILHKLHVAHRGSEFTIRHARNCVFWPGINSQVSDMCRNCVICAQYKQQHPREPLQPYPVPTLPWQLVSQDLFELNGIPYLVTVDHYSDFYEIDRLPSIQSTAVVQATKQHFGRHGIPHTLLTDNGAQYTSDLFKEFAQTYKFNHITSSPYWSQSNGRAEAAVKSAKHILRTAKDVDLALLSVRNTPPAGHTFSPAQRLFGRALRSNLPQPSVTLEPSNNINTTPLLPDKLRPSPLNPRPSYVPSTVFTASPNDARPSPMPSNATPSTPTVPPEPSSEVPSPLGPVTPPPASPSPIPRVSPVSPSPPAPQTVTRSGRVIRRPARYAD